MLTEMQKNAKHISAGKKKLFEEAERLKNLTQDSALGNFPPGQIVRCAHNDTGRHAQSTRST
jgi:hypothetical protein